MVPHLTLDRHAARMRRLARAGIDTPALLLDLDILDGNIARIAATCRQAGVGWRPHVKALKTPEIALLQLAAGALGVTCAKLGEAEVMAAAGIRDILVANQIVGPIKIARLMALARRADVIVAVDSPANAAQLAAAAAAAGVAVRVLIEVDIGLRRAGVAPGEPVRGLADAIAGLEHLRLAGLMGWESQALLIADPVAKAAAVRQAIGLLTASAALCRAAGHPVAIVSCGGTGTFPFCAGQPGVTEVQVGGGVVSDVHYRSHYHFAGPQALTLLATVTSRPTPTRIVLDAGRKAMSCDAAWPEPIGLGGVAAMRLSAEHAVIELERDDAALRVGDHVELIVGSSDSTVHLHDRIHAMRDGRIEAVWSVAARGRTA
jgi:D-serine deaminase-like pyridoxal phosphate-dependent protein